MINLNKATIRRLCGAVLALAVTATAPQASGSQTVNGSTTAPVNGSELECLAKALYFEARGEPVAGQKAVAEVILNRRDSAQFPPTVCGVVQQSNKHGCQFSYQCNGTSKKMREKQAYQRARQIAQAALAGEPRNLTHGATYFHTPAVSPSWSKRFVRTTQIGRHIFYRPGQRLAAN